MELLQGIIKVYDLNRINKANQNIPILSPAVLQKYES